MNSRMTPIANKTSTQQTPRTSAGMVSLVAETAAQTVLIALNAAIEAAHAREHRRMFAVVGTEVHGRNSRDHSLRIC
jgi:methyl-accepting chemotaxis protein